MIYKTENVRIDEIKKVSTPAEVHAEYTISEHAAEIVHKTRTEIHNLLTENDDRLLVIVGPCSIHDVNAAHEYAERLANLRRQLQEELLIVMRVYFEKPRTTVGWKGLINDPDLNDSYNINQGLRVARKLLLDLAFSRPCSYCSPTDQIGKILGSN